MNRFIPLLGIAVLTVFATITSGQSVVTDPVGFTTTTLQASSDTFVGIPFTRVPKFVGALSSTTATTIAVSGTPWTVSQFKYVQGLQPDHYYVLIGSSATKEGHKYAITDNTASTLTVATTPQDDASSIPASTQITIIPNWTPATIFPGTDANVSFTATTSPPTYKTLLRVPNYSAAGINLPYGTEYYFFNSAWRRVSDGSDGSDDALVPDGYFVVRNTNGAPTLPLTCLGGVLLKKNALPLLTAVSPGQDNPASLVRPLDVALNATGLGPAFGANDRLLLYDNAAAGLDKSPSAVYYYDTRWRLVGDATVADRGSDIIPLGTGFVVRKVGGATSFWTNSFPVAAASAVSRKTHNGTPFDVTLPLFGAPGIEPRSGGGTNDYQVVMTFPSAVSFTSASLTSGAGSVSSSSGSGTTSVTMNLTGITTGQYTTVTLASANDGTNANDVAVRVGVLVGDTNGDGSVNSGDISQTKSRSGQAVDGTNFRTDVNADGAINSGDISLVKSRTGTALPGGTNSEARE